MLFNNLEEFLSKFKGDKNKNHANAMVIDQDGDEIVEKEKATENFMNSAHGMILDMRKQLESDGIFHYLPLSQLNKMISDTKQELVKNYEKMLESINNQKNSSEICSVDSKKDQDLCETIVSTTKKGKKGKNKIPRRALLILKNWLTEHFQDPYPTSLEKIRLARETGITLKQVQNWFTNARGRIWRKTCNPEKFTSMIEEKLKNNDGSLMLPPSKFNG